MKTTTITLESLAKVLIRCFWMGMAFLIFWFVWFLVAGQWAFEFHQQWLSWTRHEFDLLNIYGMTFLKVAVFVGFLFPYFAIRLVLRGASVENE